MILKTILIYLSSLLMIHHAYSDIISTTGQLKFDINLDGSPEMVLNQNGLGLGAVPSNNLQVEGKLVISEQLNIGGSSGSSNLNIHGTVSHSFHTVSTNTTLGDHSIILCDTSSDNITLTLPDAADQLGRVYKIKKTQLENQVTVDGGGNLIDTSYQYRLETGFTGALELMADGSQWYVIHQTDGADFIPWSPIHISTNVWLDASDSSSVLTGTSDNVYQWSDKSGNDLHATQSTTGSQPTSNTRTLNDLNVLDFASDYMITDFNLNRSDTPQVSIFAVFSQDSTTGNYGLLGSDNGGWDRLILLNFDNSTGAEWGASNGNGTTALEPTRSSDANPHFLSLIWNAGTSNASLVSLDGDTPTTFTEQNGNASFSTTGIGAIRPGSRYPLNGSIAELIFINSVVDEATRLKLEGYLAWKWGLEDNLPDEHLYKNRAP